MQTITNSQSAISRKGSIISVCIVAGAIVSAGLVVREVVLYPRTDDAEVTANFIGIAPVVEGPVMQLPIHDNELIQKGALLYKIDDRPYLYALQSALAAQAALEGEIENESRRISSQVNGVDVAHAGEQNALANETRATDEIEIAKAAVARSEAALKQAQADENYATANFHRIQPLLAKGFVTEDDVHKARSTSDAKAAAVEQAQSQLLLAKASLLSASAQQQQSVAQMSLSQAQVKESAHSVLVLAPLLAQRASRASAVRLAQYNYEQCSVLAPFDARITNLTISEGQYAKVGERLFTLIDNRNWWVLANFRETQIDHVQPGTPVDVFLMSDRTKKYRGVVESASFGVTPDPDVVGKLSEGLPEVQRTLNWVRLASRYPVRIKIIDPPPATFRVGQVAVVVMRSPHREG
ncbi:HlyD family efflux transporter periplasmic adaptor subunit [Tunturiibacter lichenicola]|uniref:HlyD family efflux transporter periplasmic adaptor subunit n=1 Tax=Tunturiibacter lichenicola TaxID=2051959 RepID=UPI003D9B1BCC